MAYKARNDSIGHGDMDLLTSSQFSWVYIPFLTFVAYPFNAI